MSTEPISIFLYDFSQGRWQLSDSAFVLILPYIMFEIRKSFFKMNFTCRELSSMLLLRRTSSLLSLVADCLVEVLMLPASIFRSTSLDDTAFFGCNTRTSLKNISTHIKISLNSSQFFGFFLRLFCIHA